VYTVAINSLAALNTEITLVPAATPVITTALPAMATVATAVSEETAVAALGTITDSEAVPTILAVKYKGFCPRTVTVPRTLFAAEGATTVVLLEGVIIGFSTTLELRIVPITDGIPSPKYKRQFVKALIFGKLRGFIILTQLLSD
jgi:hypothetical protein